MSQKQRVDQQPCYILHTHPWRETSLIVEAFSRDHGRLALVAKGARRPASQLRGVLMAFQPLLLDWSGGGEVKTLVRGEWRGGQPLLGGRGLMYGYYLNELLVKLTAREDPHAALFDEYAAALAGLAHQEPPAPILRHFELALLRELGYGIGLDTDAETGEAVEPGERYVYIIEKGPARIPQRADGVPGIGGQTLLDMAEGTFARAETVSESKALLRMLINHYLNGQPLQSRRVLKEFHEL